MKVFDCIFNAMSNEQEHCIEEAMDYARGMVWSEVETTEQTIKYTEHVGEHEGVDVYYDYGADYFFFVDSEE